MCVTAPEHMTTTITMTIADRAGTGHKVTAPEHMTTTITITIADRAGTGHKVI